jgi:hypothetical protein
MTEAFIISFIPYRVAQLGYSEYHIQYKELVLNGGQTLRIDAFNELYFLVDSPDGIAVDSSYGIYDTTGTVVTEQCYQHKGQISITNPGFESRRIKFIQVIIIS